MQNINAIVNGNLQPWQQKTVLSDDYYSPELRNTRIISEDFISHYRIDFGIVPFSAKIKYYQRLIDNDITEFINNINKETIGGSDNLVAYKIDKAQKKIFNLLNEVNQLIERKQFNRSVIASRHADFRTDRTHKECTYIFNYMLVAVIRCLLEIQSHFIEFIEKDNVLAISDIYSQILHKNAPEIPEIQEIQTITIKTEDEKPTPKKDTLSFTYTKLQKQSSSINDLMDSLKLAKNISDETSITDFKHAFSGLKVNNPIRWTGNKSDLSYLIKLLCNEHKVLTFPGNSLWKVVCECFVDKDGNRFNEANLRDQKKPKLTASTIEKSALLMK